jgi:hypothetical protein
VGRPATTGRPPVSRVASGNGADVTVALPRLTADREDRSADQTTVLRRIEPGRIEPGRIEPGRTEGGTADGVPGNGAGR